MPWYQVPDISGRPGSSFQEPHMTPTSDILWLGQSPCHNIPTVGGKVANLSRLAAGHPVPPGFCITTGVFDRYAADAQAGAVLPETLLEMLATAYQDLAGRCGTTDPSVAVRSSAIDEDGRAASFAGQYETYLNIVGPDAVAGAVRRCWAAMKSPRVLEYRRRYGLPLDRGRIAVLVQQLVPADVSAVVFSANPISGSWDEVVINASWGLGESIVGGTVTPDTYTVRKAGLEVTNAQIAEKRRMTVSIPGGTQEVDVPRFMRGQPALDNARTAEIAGLAVRLEKELGWPVDVECAYCDGRLYLLQCRPITTLIAPE